MTFQVESGQDRAASNEVSTRLDEILNLTLIREEASPAVLDNRAGTHSIRFVLRNTGNGQEAFLLSAQATGGATVRAVALDSDGDGRYDPAHDMPVGPDGLTPGLPPGAAIGIFVLLDLAAATAGSVALHAEARTGSGPPGTMFPGMGDGGGDAIVGPTAAAGAVTLPFAVAPAAVSLVKSQRIVAPDGGTTPVRGAIVTYSIEAILQAGSGIAAAHVVDPIPVGTSYVTGSLRLDGSPLTEAADADAGRFDAGQIDVALGDLAAPADHTVTFAVKIN